MTSRTLFTAVALATLSFLAACGGGNASDDGRAQPDGVGGIGGSGVTSQGVGGIGGSGVTTQGVGGIGGSGVVAQGVGGIGGSGVTTQGVGGIGGSGVTTQGVGGVGGIGGSGIAGVASVSLKACSLRSVNVTVAGVRVNQDATADAGGAGWVDVALASPVRVDLLALSAAGTLPVDLTTLPDGTYRQLRLVLVADDANTPLADSIVTADRAELALAVPSAAQGGLPLSATVTVAGGQVAASYAPVDACGAVHSAGGTYALGGVVSGAAQVASAY